MFTGLIESLGTVAGVDPVPGGLRLAVETSLAPELREGDSLAVNGVCLTVTGIAGPRAAFDIGPQTARLTALAALRAGSAVNLERALRADTRVGGHFVQGHVDATGQLVAVRPESEFVWMTFGYPREHAAYLIPRGSIAVDGVSLTVAALDGDRFDVQIIPFTWTHTNFSTLVTGALVNVEFDMLGKYAVRAAELASRREMPILP